MSQRHPQRALRPASKFLIAAATLAAAAFPAAADAAIAVPHAASAVPVTVPTAPAPAPSSSIRVNAPSPAGGDSGVSSAGTESPAPVAVPSGEGSQAPGDGQQAGEDGGERSDAQSNDLGYVDLLRQSRLSGQALSEAITEAKEFANVLTGGISSTAPVFTSWPPALTPDPNDATPSGGPVPDFICAAFNFLGITEQVENGDHNGSCF